LSIDEGITGQKTLETETGWTYIDSDFFTLYLLSVEVCFGRQIKILRVGSTINIMHEGVFESLWGQWF
jgi:hypothetical protein